MYNYIVDGTNLRSQGRMSITQSFYTCCDITSVKDLGFACLKYFPTLHSCLAISTCVMLLCYCMSKAINITPITKQRISVSKGIAEKIAYKL